MLLVVAMCRGFVTLCKGMAVKLLSLFCFCVFWDAHNVTQTVAMAMRIGAGCECRDEQPTPPEMPAILYYISSPAAPAPAPFVAAAAAESTARAAGKQVGRKAGRRGKDIPAEKLIVKVLKKKSLC